MSPADGKASSGRGRRWLRVARVWGFAVLALALHGVLWLTNPERAAAALTATGQVLRQVAIPLGVAFLVMILLNVFVDSARVSRVVGRNAGVKGLVFSTLAGVFSMGPIYAWYPMLKTLREKGASEFHLANFLCQRAVKPFLLPVMIFYFGWLFTLVFTIVTVLCAIAVATIVALNAREAHAGAHEPQ